LKLIPTSLPEVLLIEPRVFGDARGFFFESWNERSFAELGISAHFVQDNHSRSAKGVLRGLHYQVKQPQGKLLRVIEGEIFDVVVDIRRSSPNFAKVFTARLSSNSKQMLWVPVGFAHGFCVTSDHAEVLYKTTDFYAPEHERTIAWNDPELAIPWPLETAPTLSGKDSMGLRLSEGELFP
jgi:dTDP-4-dehydrorhamnose 3,5-epimerase